jgi:hypothetical protein
MPDRDIADLQARTKILEESLGRVEQRIETKQDSLAKDFADLKIIVVTAIATAKVKWQVLFKVAALVGVVAAIIAAIVKFVMMK